MLGTVNVVDILRARGFEVSNAYVSYLLRERVIASPEKGVGGCLIWTDADVGRLRGELIRRGRGPEETVPRADRTRLTNHGGSGASVTAHSEPRRNAVARHNRSKPNASGMDKDLA